MNILKKLFKKQKGTGALLDERTEEEKIKDYKFEEIVSKANPVEWREKSQNEWRKFPIFDQNGSGSCVAQTLAKLLGIIYWLKNGNYVHFSATHIYQRRANKPASGMGGIDALDIARKGVTLEVLAPSQKMTDEQMDSIVIENYKQEVGQIFKIGNYVILPIQDIDTVASVIQTTGKGVMVWFYFKIDEWTNEPQVKYPDVDLRGVGIARHSVTAVDFALWKGKKALIIEDSWGVNYGYNGRRVITEDFYKARNFFAAYPINFKFEESTIQKPSHTFAFDLKFGEINEDVQALQNILKYEGLFPANVESTGYYGAITAKAVLAFQKKYKVADDAELDALGGRIVGPKTRSKLNELYS
ncbi:MAG: hypothetical protein KatS3mg101_1099 [Patescibacteria group bacterium]|nr:MAG: hypothetical protein KatS3mg101_1099 [Patescibacteria group bacterium]